MAVVPELRDLRGASLARTPCRFRSATIATTSRALLAAVTERTKLVYVCNPNNPTGTMSSRAELDAYFERVPDHVLTVLDQAYFEYIDDPDYADGIKEYFKAGRRVLVLRTFSKIYGLAGLRVGYAVGPAEIVTALGKTRRAFDLTTPAQEAALASLDFPEELERRRRVNADGRSELVRILRRRRLPRGGAGCRQLRLRRSRRGRAAVVRGIAARGRDRTAARRVRRPNAIRVTVGTHDEHEFLAAALGRVEDSHSGFLTDSDAELTSVRRQLSLLGTAPGFRLLFFATLGSSLGTLLATVALVVDVKDRTNSGSWVSALMIVEFLPAVAVGLFLGPLLDRLSRRGLMVVSDLVRAGVFFTLPFAHTAGQIVALAGVAGIATGFFRPAVYAGLPNLVDEEQLANANSLIQTSENVSWTVAPIIGGALVAAAGPDVAYWINGVSFLSPRCSCCGSRQRNSRARSLSVVVTSAT